MKHITKLAFIVAAVAAIGTSVASADDQQLRHRLNTQRQELQNNQQPTTIAIYAGRRGVSQRSMMRDERTGTRFELRSNAHGQVYPAYVPAK